MGDEARALRVLIVDDQRAFADALSIALGSRPGLECVGTLTSARDIAAHVAELSPDVVVMDALLPGIDGIEATRQIKAEYPHVRVVVLTGSPDPGLVLRAVRVGASGFLPKGSSFDEIHEVVRGGDTDRMVVDPHLLVDLLERARAEGEARPRPAVTLTAREQEVLVLLGEGSDVTEISRLLGMSVHTCRGHVKSLLVKLGAHSQLEAVVQAARFGLLPGHPLVN